MKKLIFTLLFAIIATTSYCQFSFKSGLINSIAIDDNAKYSSTVFGSAMVEINWSYTGKVALTGNIGYLRHDNFGEGFNQFPILAGIKYRFNETFYTGTSGGLSFFSQKPINTDFTFSINLGANIAKHLSADIRYLHTLTPTALKTIALVLSYNF